ncbi:inner-membrane translocator [Streptomyces sp. NPDC060006]|uniref:inner-membrane translocator n=1 Tax=unclassified Streptomyces TaxID=2593676 RepID=UPI0036304453
MPPLADKRSFDWKDALISGCILLLALVADAVAVLAVVMVLAVRALGWLDAGLVPGAGPPPEDWTPVLGFGGLALVIAATGVVMLRLEQRVVGVVQLVIGVALAGNALRLWP